MVVAILSARAGRCHKHISMAAAAGGRAWSGAGQCTGRVQPALHVHAGRAAGGDAPELHQEDVGMNKDEGCVGAYSLVG